MRKHNLIAAYLLFVGAPLLGLLGILHAGRGLTAPMHVAGAWVLEGDFRPLAGAPCAELLTAAQPLILNISQNGSHITSTFNSQQSAFSGIMDGHSLIVGVQEPSAARSAGPRCDDAVSMTAVLDKRPGEPLLTGTLTINTCPQCSPVSFRATREILPAKGGR